MSIVAKAFKKAELTLEGNNTLPPNQRKLKCFQRLINALRATEAEVSDNEKALLDRALKAEEQRNEALQENANLREELTRKDSELLQHRLRNGMEHIANLTVTDRTKLLECVS